MTMTGKTRYKVGPFIAISMDRWDVTFIILSLTMLSINWITDIQWGLKEAIPSHKKLCKNIVHSIEFAEAISSFMVKVEMAKAIHLHMWFFFSIWGGKFSRNQFRNFQIGCSISFTFSKDIFCHFNFYHNRRDGCCCTRNQIR